MQTLERQRQDGFRLTLRALRTQGDVRKLEERIDVLEAEIAYLRDAFAPSTSVPPEWGLTAAESRILGCLLTRQLVSMDALMATLYSIRGGEIPARQTIEVFLSFLRRKLRPHGVIIRNSYGQGWYIEPADRERLRAQLLSDGA